MAPWLPTARGTGQAPPNWSASSGPERRESAHRGWSFSAATLAAPSEPRHRARGEWDTWDTWTAAFFGPGESLKIFLKHLGNGGFCSDKSSVRWYFLPKMRWKDWNERDEFKKNLKDLLPKGCLWKLVGTVADWRRGSGRFLAGL